MIPGNASDSLSNHNGYMFSTVDVNNDKAPACCPCAPAYGGGWWFFDCFESNLNGEYIADPKVVLEFRHRYGRYSKQSIYTMLGNPSFTF